MSETAAEKTIESKPPYLMYALGGTTIALLVYEAYQHKLFPWQGEEEDGDEDEGI